MSTRESYYDYLPMTDDALARVDPVEMNLLVAKSIPALSDLDIPLYQAHADAWAEGVRARLPDADRDFAQSPEYWTNDINFTRLAVLCEHIDCGLGMAYREDQQNVWRIKYTDPSDLFLNGVMETGRGTCGNMAMVHVALAWRLGWPVFLACVDCHFLARYDDGKRTYNIEATQTGRGGFSSPTDECYIAQFRLPRKAITCGSDLRALKPREMLGCFVGLRARHMKDTGRIAEAERDYLLARHLFPANRYMHFGTMWVLIKQSTTRFEPSEEGSPMGLAGMIGNTYVEYPAPVPSCMDRNPQKVIYCGVAVDAEIVDSHGRVER